MSPRYAYFYLMKDEPDRLRGVVPRHVEYWRSLNLPGYLGGPFQDRTGGLIIFETDDPSQARNAVDADPFVRDGLLASYWLKQWTPQ